jgi:1-aminocyclopropane-1-carboxylate deaminase
MQFYMQPIDLNNITIDRISVPGHAGKNLETDVLRLDKIHPLVSGNKWFKLQYYLEEANRQDKKTILTYGGAWSNHIIATAAACKMKGLNSIGIIRGEEAPALSPTLVQAKEMGMRLFFISREAYRDKAIPAIIDQNDCYLVPEGGYGVPGARGASSIADHFRKDHYTHLCCAAGTGTMSAGLLQTAGNALLVVISVLKNNNGLESNIRQLAGNDGKRMEIIHDYHFSGYAKYQPGLIDFMNEFFRDTGIPTDFVYTAKTFFAVNDLVRNNYFPPGSRLLLIHSGGLQGNASLNNGTLIF